MGIDLKVSIKKPNKQAVCDAVKEKLEKIGIKESKILFDRLETACLLRISPITLFRLMRDRKIAYVRIGDRPFFTLEDIYQFIEMQKRSVA